MAAEEAPPHPVSDGEPKHPTAAAKSSGPKGYPFLAHFWSQTQTGMARKFKRLAALNILYLQAELSHLERELERQRRRDLETGRREREDCDWNWLLLSEPALHRGSRQWEVALEIREKLGEYCMFRLSIGVVILPLLLGVHLQLPVFRNSEALVKRVAKCDSPGVPDSALSQYSRVTALATPTEKQRKEMFKIVGSSSLNERLGAFQSLDLAGIEGPAAYDGENAHDLVLLDGEEEENDFLSTWLVEPLFRAVHCLCKRHKVCMQKRVESFLNMS